MTKPTGGLQIKVAPKAPQGTPMRCCVPACPRSPARVAEIIGWPAGRVCTGHAREWRAAWDGALAPATDGAAA